MAGLQYLDLDLLFERADGGFQLRMLHSPAGDGQVTRFALPVGEVELENLRAEDRHARIRTRRQESVPVTAAKDLGGRLFGAVSPGRWESACGAARASS